MTIGRLSASGIFERTFDAIAADRARFALYFVAMTAIGIGIDEIPNEAASAVMIFLSVAISIMFQTKVTEAVLMMRDGAEPADVSRNRYMAVFGALFVSGLGILAGLVLLIIPGLFLLVRWYVLIPALLDGRNDQQSAYKKSYRLTGREMGAVTLVAFVFVLPFLLLVALPILEAFDIATNVIGFAIDSESTGFGIFLNSVVSLSGLGSWYAAAVMYLMLNDDHHGLSEVFS